jgi:hypothetical protein
MTLDFMKQTALKLKMTTFLDDVRGIQLINVMNNIRISNMTPREVIDEKYDKDQVVLPIFMQKMINQAQVVLMIKIKVN